MWQYAALRVTVMRRVIVVAVAGLGLAAFAYAGLFGVEGVGLWLGKRWAEFLTVIATGSFIPFETYEMVRKFNAVRITALVLNVAVVIYLIYRIRANHRHSAN